MVEFFFCHLNVAHHWYIGVNGSIVVSLQDLMRILATRKGLNYKKYKHYLIAGFEKIRFNRSNFFFLCIGIKMIVTINLHESGNELSKNEPITNIYQNLFILTWLHFMFIFFNFRCKGVRWLCCYKKKMWGEGAVYQLPSSAYGTFFLFLTTIRIINCIHPYFECQVNMVKNF